MTKTTDQIFDELQKDPGGAYMHCYPSGVRFWPFDPRLRDIYIQDIAHHLSLVCRFGGASKFHYSVAQHSVLVSQFMEYKGFDAKVQYAGLMHDAAEAYLGDIIMPIKSKTRMDSRGYKEVEDKLQGMICEAFEVPWDKLTRSMISVVDWRLCQTEAYTLQGAHVVRAWDNFKENDLIKIGGEVFRIEEQHPMDAEWEFLDRFKSLREELDLPCLTLH